ncbi:MAG: hypothetical protein R6U36_10635 [Candidatus Fermentibacteraceae bacterium]
MILQMLLALAVSAFAESPEALLDSLCSRCSGEGAVRCWQSCADPAGTTPSAHPDTIRALLQSCSDLSVEPGEHELGETGETFYVLVFPESEWTSTDGEGTDRVVRGRTEVVFRDGRFYWRSIPLSPGREGAAVSSGQRILMGMMLTGVTLVVALLALWWAKRRWG